MPKITVVARDGEEHEVEAETGLSLMEVIRENGISGLMTLCGGVCSCATCHVHIQSGPDIGDLLPPISDDESDLLDSSSDRDDTSRLSCQIPVTEALDGLRVKIAADDWS